MKRLSSNEFIEKAKLINGDRFVYTKTNYVNARTKICVICSVCNHEWLQIPPDHIKGRSCPKCSGHECTFDDFVRKAQAVHDKNYVYTQYNGALTKIDIYCITCTKTFSQLPSNHLAGRGCPLCAKRKLHKHDRSSFIRVGELKHNSKFEYIDLPEQVTVESKIKIHCRPCVITYEQWAKEHLKGRNSCPGCGPRTMTQERFVQKATKIHDGRYDYSNTIYVRTNAHVKIECRACGKKFSQQPNNHFQGQGCPTCGNKRKGQGLKREAYERFLEHVKLNASKYDYTRSIYVNNKTKMLIGCLNCHEDFEQNPFAHVVMEQGCPRCAKLAQTSKGEISWLDFLNIPLEARNRFVTLSNKRKVNVDALHEGIVYEYYGRYWHGDPRTTNQASVHAYLQVPMSEVYSDTIKRFHQIAASGYKIRFVWEDDYVKGQKFSEYHPHELCHAVVV